MVIIKDNKVANSQCGEICLLKNSTSVFFSPRLHKAKLCFVGHGRLVDSESGREFSLIITVMFSLINARARTVSYLCP